MTEAVHRGVGDTDPVFTAIKGAGDTIIDIHRRSWVTRTVDTLIGARAEVPIVTRGLIESDEAAPHLSASIVGAGITVCAWWPEWDLIRARLGANAVLSVRDREPTKHAVARV